MGTTGRRAMGACCWALVLAGGCAAANLTTFRPALDRSEGLSGDHGVLLREAEERYAAVGGGGERNLAGLDAIAARLEKVLSLAPPSGDDGGLRQRVLLARVYLDMVEALEVPAQRESYADKVVVLGREVQRGAPGRVEGPYYQAIGMARRLDANRELGLIKPMMALAQTAVDIDPAYDDAGALSLMGKIYLEAPPWPASVGDEDAAVEVLTRAVSLAPTPVNRLFLGQALFHAEEPTRAAEELRRAYDEGKQSGLSARWITECEDYLRRVDVRP